MTIEYLGIGTRQGEVNLFCYIEAREGPVLLLWVINGGYHIHLHEDTGQALIVYDNGAIETKEPIDAHILFRGPWPENISKMHYSEALGYAREHVNAPTLWFKLRVATYPFTRRLNRLLRSLKASHKAFVTTFKDSYTGPIEFRREFTDPEETKF